MSSLTPYSTGIDRATGRPMHDFDHVVQSAAVIFSTEFGQRVMREWFGSDVPGLLGSLMNRTETLAFFNAMAEAIDLHEPRLKVRKVEPLSVSRSGAFGVRLVVEYRPRGHLGDPTPEAALRAINATYDGGRWNTLGGS